MTRTRMIRLGCGLGILAGAWALLGTPAPVHAADIRIGALVNAGRGGTTVGGFVQIGQAPRPHVVATPMVTERVWVPTQRVEIREVPVFDPRGRVVAYRQEHEVIHGGHWEIVTRPAEQRYYAPPPGRVPTGRGHLRQAVPAGCQAPTGTAAMPVRDLLRTAVAHARR